MLLLAVTQENDGHLPVEVKEGNRWAILLEILDALLAGCGHRAKGVHLVLLLLWDCVKGVGCWFNFYLDGSAVVKRYFCIFCIVNIFICFSFYLPNYTPTVRVTRLDGMAVRAKRLKVVNVVRVAPIAPAHSRDGYDMVNIKDGPGLAVGARYW